MAAKVASLQAFRSRRMGGATGDGPAAGTAADAGGEHAALAPPANDAGPGGAERARRFHELALPQLDAAYNLARYLCRDAAAAEDIVQDAYLRALRGFDGYRGGDPRAWILQIVRNRFHDWVRERRLNPAAPLVDAEEDGMADFPDTEAATPEEVLAGAEEAVAVRAVVAGLPAPFREALVLREMEDLSYREIAAVTGTPIGTVMSRLARARQMFGEAWRRLAAADGGTVR
ncbi:sigma-70 family RNA polymerase sigma factor [Dankookia sp. P2]|uniref:sigma-70 family RNA polymerase sigma factor n=1 Tax=Dankookia sp. P2 TaxID=3423955 RepID=UPI003D66B454